MAKNDSSEGEHKELLLKSEEKRHPGIGVPLATTILVGELAGSGMLALPSILLGTGLGGIAFLAFFSVSCAYVGSRIALCWEILEECGHHEFRSEPGFATKVRDPYPLMAEKAGQLYSPAAARILRVVTIVCIVVALYGGACVVHLLFSNFLTDLTGVLDTCTWLVIVTVLFTPLNWFATPKDSWHIAVISLSSVLLSAILIVGQCISQSMNSNFQKCNVSAGFANETMSPVYDAEFPTPTLEGYFIAAGTIQFAYSGISTFPTVQADMADKKDFKWAAIACFLLLFFIYAPVAGTAYLTFGNCLRINVIASLNDGFVKTAVQILMMAHLITTSPILINAPNQYFENVLNIPHEWSIKRLIFRTVVMFIMLFICASVPNFGSILGLIGASAVTIITFVFPPLVYVTFTRHSKSRILAKSELCLCVVLVIAFIFGGIMATYQAVNTIFVTHFEMPCYLP